MTAKALTTSWMWSAEDGVNGLTLDTDDRRLLWFDSFGCACGDSTSEQTFEQFRKKGPVLPLPDDILEELHYSLTALEGQNVAS